MVKYLQDILEIIKSRNVCYFVVVNLTNQCSLFMTVRHIFEISEDDHPHWSPTPAIIDELQTTASDFANAFVFPGVNSRAELVPSPRAYARNGARRCWLGDKTPHQ
jgi:hypothetical protein